MQNDGILALVLDREHRVLVDARGVVPRLEGAPDSRSLTRLQEHVHSDFGVQLASPAGSRRRAAGEAPCEFLFLVDSGVQATSGARWVRLAEAVLDDLVWDAYADMVLGGFEPLTRDFDVFAFGVGLEMAAYLSHLVVCGRKRATTCWLKTVELGLGVMPAPGMLSVVTDGLGFPRCVIRTESVERLRFGDVTAQLAALEGEGDQSLEDWRRAHLAFFDNEAAARGATFDDGEIVVFERFVVLHIVGRAD